MTSTPNVKDSIKPEKQPLPQRVVEGLAKIEALEAIQVTKRMNRDADRLHQRALATYAATGLDVQEETGEGDMRDQTVLGDQIVIGVDLLLKIATRLRAQKIVHQSTNALQVHLARERYIQYRVIQMVLMDRIR